MFKTITLALALAVATGAAWAADPLRIGVEGAYPPFSQKAADGTLSGFDIDIANAICAKLERECQLVEQDWDGMIPALKANKFDAIVASMSITPERKQQVDFSQKYYQTPARFVAKKGSGLEITPEGLKGKRVGVQRGTIHQCYLDRKFKDAEIVMYGTQEEVYQDLALGRLDAQLSDSIAADDGFLKKDEGKEFEFVGGDQVDECFGEGAGVAVRKEDTELRDQISGAIKAIREDGSYETINKKYFDYDIYGG